MQSSLMLPEAQPHAGTAEALRPITITHPSEISHVPVIWSGNEQDEYVNNTLEILNHAAWLPSTSPALKCHHHGSHHTNYLIIIRRWSNACSSSQSRNQRVSREVPRQRPSRERCPSQPPTRQLPLENNLTKTSGHESHKHDKAVASSTGPAPITLLAYTAEQYPITTRIL